MSPSTSSRTRSGSGRALSSRQTSNISASSASAESTSTYPFDGLISDTAWLELSAQFPSIELYAQTSDAVRAAEAGFDGVYTYDVYAVRGGAFAGFCAGARKAGIACAPSVGPGYNAARATSDHRVRSRRAGATYDGMWRAAIAAEPDRITITSYNEWHEGTQIEAARARPTSDLRGLREL